MIRLDSIPIPVNGLYVKELGDAIIILSDNGDELHSLDEVGGFIWRSINGSSTVQDIIVMLLQEYDVGKSQAEEDIKNFLFELEEKKLIKI